MEKETKTEETPEERCYITVTDPTLKQKIKVISMLGVNRERIVFLGLEALEKSSEYKKMKENLKNLLF